MVGDHTVNCVTMFGEGVHITYIRNLDTHTVQGTATFHDNHTQQTLMQSMLDTSTQSPAAQWDFNNTMNP